MPVIKMPKKSTVRNLRTRLLTVVIVAILCVTSVFAASSASYSVQVNDGDNTYTIRTGLEDPNEIISGLDLNVTEKDQIDLSGFTSGKDSVITIQRAFPVTVIDDETETTVMTTKATVAEVLQDENITVNENDIVNHELNAPLADGMVITIKRTFPVTVIEDGERTVIHARAGSVGTGLFDAGIAVEEGDAVQPAAHLMLRSGMEVTINRAQDVVRSETETIAYSVEKEKTNTLYQGEKKKVQSGSKGEKLVVYKDRIVNGEVIETSVVSETVTKEPKAEKWLIGTKKKAVVQSSSDKASSSSVSSGSSSVSGSVSRKTISTLTPPDWVQFDSKGLPLNYKSIIRGPATAYTAPKGALTSTGKKARLGYVAVDPREIPYGTKMFIVSEDGKYVYGYCIAADTGGFIYNSNTVVDLYFSTTSQCYNFGRRNVKIYIL